MDTIHAYMAGVVDSDGTIGIRCYRGSTNELHYRPMIEITNMSKDMIDLFAKTFGNSSVYERRMIYKMGGIWTWRVTGTHTIPVIKAILPYLIFKIKQANLCLKMASRIGKQGTKWTNDFRLSEQKIRKDFYMQAKALNTH